MLHKCAAFVLTAICLLIGIGVKAEEEKRALMFERVDVVPSIPEEMEKKASLIKAMESYGMQRSLAESVAHHSGNITDNRDPNYAAVHPDWRISNSEGYAVWFESRMQKAKAQMEKVAAMASRSKVEKLPLWQWKSPLQQAIQILKRHRDCMFKSNPDSKPISVIITTLAGLSYDGQDDVSSALDAILAEMDAHIHDAEPKIPNPVNPNEDFADKWYDQEHAHLDLEGNFKNWLNQARIDFGQLGRLASSQDLEKFLNEKFRAKLEAKDLEAIARMLPACAAPYSGIQIITERPARPWSSTV